MDAFLSRINGLDYGPGRVATFSEFIEAWKAQMLTTQRPSSARAVRSHLKCYILPELGNVRLHQFGVENQQKFITRMPERATNKTVSRKTILNVLGTLSTILTTARNWGYNCELIDTNKLRLPPRGIKYEAPSFTPDQLRQILALAEEPWRTMQHSNVRRFTRGGGTRFEVGGHRLQPVGTTHSSHCLERANTDC